jgi:hypothetical protein
MNTLYSRIQSLEKELSDDDAALKWFNFRKTSSSNPSKTAIPVDPSTPLASMPNHHKNIFEGKQVILELWD